MQLWQLSLLGDPFSFLHIEKCRIKTMVYKEFQNATSQREKFIVQCILFLPRKFINFVNLLNETRKEGELVELIVSNIGFSLVIFDSFCLRKRFNSSL